LCELPEVVNCSKSYWKRYGLTSYGVWDPTSLQYGSSYVYIGGRLNERLIKLQPELDWTFDSKWKNDKYLVPIDGTYEQVVQKYRKWILSPGQEQSKLLADLPELKGKILGYWYSLNHVMAMF
jgi:hypothetical protein